jgi:uncharacterized protein YkwD
MRRPLIIAGAVGLVTVAAGVLVATTANAGTNTYEAEAAGNSLAGGARSVDCSRCSGGKRIGWVGTTGVLTFTGVTAERDGSTTVSVTYTNGERRTGLLSVNGGTATAINFPSTRGFTRPGTLRIKVTLKKGVNTLAFGNPSGWAPDFDKLVVATDGTPPAPVPTATITGAPVTAVPTAGPTDAPPVTPSATPTAVPTSPTATTAPTAPKPPTTPDAPKPPAPTAAPTAAPTTPPKPPVTQPPTGNAALEAQVVDLVNVERAKLGCTPIRANDQLTQSARGHSADMAARGYFDHTTPEGVTFSTRISNAGYQWRGAAENIAKGQRSPADVMNSWMNSAGHKANIQNCKYLDLGVGVVADAKGSLIWTQNFGIPR